MKHRTFFIDSSFIYALLNRRDQFHEQAITVLSKLQDDDFFVLTDAIILESCSLLAALGARETIVEFVDDIKEWSLVDCLSSLVMQEQSIQLALTSDHHFEQMGFLAVLRHHDLI